MPELIDFLERMGQDSRLRHAGPARLDAELASIGINGETRTALLNGDTAALESILGATPNVCCLVVGPDDDDPPRG